MKIEQWIVSGMIFMALVVAKPGMSASLPHTSGVPTQMVITARPDHGGNRPGSLVARDLIVLKDKGRVPVVSMQRLAGDFADMQLFVLLDDSTRSSSLSLQLPELKTFLKSLPATTQVAVGYMRNGTFTLDQSFTADHQKVANSLRLPMAIPGVNGSPYFALSDLVKHWPSKQATSRRAVLMLTDGVDRYFGSATKDDPYVNAATKDALKKSVMVYSIYLQGAGLSGRWLTNVAQSRLIEVSQETGGYAYFQGFTDPVTISPFLNDLQDRLENQYLVTVDALNEKGFHSVKLQTELPGLKIEGPRYIYVR